MVETLFYKTYYSFLLGNLKDTEMYYSFLKEEIHSISDLSKDRWLELRKIRDAIRTGNLSVGVWTDSTVFNNTTQIIETSDLEKDIVEKIGKDGTSQLKEILGASDSLYLANLEHPCEPYGKVDMIYMDGTNIYPVEVKRNIGKHDLLGQVMKYNLSIRLKLHYNIYKHVRFITICSGYTDFVLTELKKMNVLPLCYKIQNNKLLIFLSI